MISLTPQRSTGATGGGGDSCSVPGQGKRCRHQYEFPSSSAQGNLNATPFERGYKSNGGGFALFIFQGSRQVADVASTFFSSITLTRHNNYKCNPCHVLTSTLKQSRLSKCAAPVGVSIDLFRSCELRHFMFKY